MTQTRAGESRLPRVGAVTVTYANRWELLSRVLAALIANDPPLHDIVIVDNGSDYALKDRAECIDPRIHVVRLPTNVGSAAGFRIGIETASARERVDLIWLLDDDNRPRPGALRALLDRYEALGSTPLYALAAVRPDIVRFAFAARKLPDDAFLRFHWAFLPGILQRRLGRRADAARTAEIDASPVEVRHVPYGGFLFHLDWVRRIGLPRDDFYLYADDLEYTSRIPAAGGRILLCPDAVIEDIDKSWHAQSSRAHPYFNREADERRLYYSIRNEVFLERNRFVRSRLAYALNRFVLLAALAAHSLAVDRDPALTLRRLRILLRAMREGDRGRLGKILDSDWTARLGSKAH